MQPVQSYRRGQKTQSPSSQGRSLKGIEAMLRPKEGNTYTLYPRRHNHYSICWGDERELTQELTEALTRRRSPRCKHACRGKKR
jgi:hypothetical protein